MDFSPYDKTLNENDLDDLRQARIPPLRHGVAVLDGSCRQQLGCVGRAQELL